MKLQKTAVFYGVALSVMTSMSFIAQAMSREQINQADIIGYANTVLYVVTSPDGNKILRVGRNSLECFGDFKDKSGVHIGLSEHQAEKQLDLVKAAYLEKFGEQK